MDKDPLLYSWLYNLVKLMCTFFSFLVPHSNTRKFVRKMLFEYIDKININLLVKNAQKMHQKKIRSLKVKKKLKVAFLVAQETVFPAKNVFCLMKRDSRFDPRLVAIPYITKGVDFKKEQFERTVEYLKQLDNEVLIGYDSEREEFYDLLDGFDFVCTANPYEEITHKFFTAKYAVNEKKIIPFFIGYSYQGRTTYERYLFGRTFFKYMWRIFIENKEVGRLINSSGNVKNENMIVTGYPKMDSLELVTRRKRTRKKLIIALHHTLKHPRQRLPLSQFMRYADVILHLPAQYPMIDFVLRPHYLLFIHLQSLKIWDNAKINEYIEKFTSFNNGFYDDTADYMDLFANSDGMIHDCGSFLAEYMYTLKPQCYLLESPQQMDEIFLPLGKKMLENCYLSFNEKHFLSFIDNVIVAGKDPMENARKKFAWEEIMINYPNASNCIVNYIKNQC